MLEIQSAPFLISSNWARAFGALLYEQYIDSEEKNVEQTVRNFMNSEYYKKFNVDISYDNKSKFLWDKDFSDLKRWLKCTIACVEKGTILAFR